MDHHKGKSTVLTRVLILQIKLHRRMEFNYGQFLQQAFTPSMRVVLKEVLILDVLVEEMEHEW
ncbi:MAG: hypothetical protein EB023_13605 [Flavobacteriia bacterium]|nr:hypothetical protein [Flavobacteriia bacterium]